MILTTYLIGSLFLVLFCVTSEAGILAQLKQHQGEDETIDPRFKVIPPSESQVVQETVNFLKKHNSKMENLRKILDIEKCVNTVKWKTELHRLHKRTIDEVCSLLRHEANSDYGNRKINHNAPEKISDKFAVKHEGISSEIVEKSLYNCTIILKSPNTQQYTYHPLYIAGRSLMVGPVEIEKKSIIREKKYPYRFEEVVEPRSGFNGIYYEYEMEFFFLFMNAEHVGQTVTEINDKKRQQKEVINDKNSKYVLVETVRLDLDRDAPMVEIEMFHERRKRKIYSHTLNFDSDPEKIIPITAYLHKAC